MRRNVRALCNPCLGILMRETERQRQRAVEECKLTSPLTLPNKLLRRSEGRIQYVISDSADRMCASSPVSRHIVLMRTNVSHVLNRVPEHDSLTFFMLHN